MAWFLIGIAAAVILVMFVWSCCIVSGRAGDQAERMAAAYRASAARTDEEGDILMEVTKARMHTNEAKQELARYHRDYEKRARPEGPTR